MSRFSLGQLFRQCVEPLGPSVSLGLLRPHVPVRPHITTCAVLIRWGRSLRTR